MKMFENPPPDEPTPAMIRAGAEAIIDEESGQRHVLDMAEKVWRAMWAAWEDENAPESCPHCQGGVDAEVLSDGKGGRKYQARCYGCDAAGPVEESEEKALDAWRRLVGGQQAEAKG